MSLVWSVLALAWRPCQRPPVLLACPPPPARPSPPPGFRIDVNTPRRKGAFLGAHSPDQPSSPRDWRGGMTGPPSDIILRQDRPENALWIIASRRASWGGVRRLGLSSAGFRVSTGDGGGFAGSLSRQGQRPVSPGPRQVVSSLSGPSCAQPSLASRFSRLLRLGSAFYEGLPSPPLARCLAILRHPSAASCHRQCFSEKYVCLSSFVWCKAPHAAPTPLPRHIGIERSECGRLNDLALAQPAELGLLLNRRLLSFLDLFFSAALSPVQCLSSRAPDRVLTPSRQANVSVARRSPAPSPRRSNGKQCTRNLVHNRPALVHALDLLHEHHAQRDHCRCVPGSGRHPRPDYAVDPPGDMRLHLRCRSLTGRGRGADGVPRLGHRRGRHHLLVLPARHVRVGQLGDV